MFLMIAPVMLQGLATSPVGVACIQKYEGIRLKAYLCPANVWTIGYGHTKDVTKGMRITKELATAYLKYDLWRFEKYVTRTIPRELKWYENDGLVSFCFNLGYRLKGRLRIGIISRDTALVKHKINLYVKARVRGVLTMLKGLVRRRNDEAELYCGNYHNLSFFNKKHLSTEQLREAVWGCEYR